MIIFHGDCNSQVGLATHKLRETHLRQSYFRQPQTRMPTNSSSPHMPPPLSLSFSLFSLLFNKNKTLHPKELWVTLALWLQVLRTYPWQALSRGQKGVWKECYSNAFTSDSPPTPLYLKNKTLEKEWLVCTLCAYIV